MPNRLVSSIRNKISEYKKNNSLPGEWELFEYYTDTEKELVNVKEDQLKSEKLFWNIGFGEDGKFSTNSNLDIPYVTGIEASSWSKSKNFVTFLHSGDFRKNTEFQFAFEKGNLKLLKKDEFGKIIVFAFFKRIS